MKTLPKQRYQVRVMVFEKNPNRTESINTLMQNAVTLMRAQNKNGGTTGRKHHGHVALCCTCYNNFLVKGTAPSKKKPICTETIINI